MNTNDYTKISFDYPNCVHEYDLIFYIKMLSDDEHNIRFNAYVVKKTSNNYMNEKKEYVIGLKNEYRYDVHYTDINHITTKNNMKTSILQVNYEYSYNFSTDAYDTWYIAVELEEKLILAFEIESRGQTINYESIQNMLNSIKVEKDAASFKHSKIENGYQIGTIKQNLYDSYEDGYKIKYKVSEKYPEIDSLETNINSAVFQYDDLNEKMHVQLSIKNSNYEDYKEQIEKWKKATVSSYGESEEIYRNIKDTGVLEKIINNKNVYYFIYTYDYYLNNEMISTNYISRVFMK